MHLQTYILTIAESKEDAEGNVRGFVEDRVGDGRWFDYGDVDGQREVNLLSEIREELLESMEYPETELKEAFAEFDKNRALGDDYRGSTGYQARRIAGILCQEFTDAMPFYNSEELDWSLPQHDDDGVKKYMAAREADTQSDCQFKWYAVPVDLHF